MDIHQPPLMRFTLGRMNEVTPKWNSLHPSRPPSSTFLLVGVPRATVMKKSSITLHTYIISKRVVTDIYFYVSIKITAKGRGYTHT